MRNEGLGRGEREKAEDYIPLAPLPSHFSLAARSPFPCSHADHARIFVDLRRMTKLTVISRT